MTEGSGYYDDVYWGYIIVTECLGYHYVSRSMNVMRDISMIDECYEGYYYKDCYSDTITRECWRHEYDAQSRKVVRDMNMVARNGIRV